MSRKKYHRGRRLADVKKARRKKKLMGAGLLCVLVMLFVQMASAVGKDKSAQIVLAPESQSMIQGEEMLKMKATVNCSEEQKKVVLDKESDYRVEDLLQELKSGNGYSMHCDADGMKEGKFPIKLKLSDELSDRIQKEWEGKVFLTISDGYLKVKNKIGQWKGSKFQKYDGSYVKEDFVTSKGKTYYFGSDGKKVSGWQEINGKKYFFTKKGVMETDTWKKDGKEKYYLSKEGAATIGWLELGEDLYYFDGEGIMLTGKQQIGSSECVFADDGKLKSKESKIDPDKPMMALTFDDGPGERTDELLDVLEQYDAHATFFMQGIHVKTYKKEIKRMVEIGCELGNHTYDHPQLTKEMDGGVNQVGKTNELLKEVCGQPATVLRPPYGAVNDQVKASVGMPMILWNIDTLDWKTKDVQNTVNVVLTTADDGDIVLMHDIHSASIDAAIELIPRLIAEGYQLVTVSEMAEARGIVLQNGTTYTDFNK